MEFLNSTKKKEKQQQKKLDCLATNCLEKQKLNLSQPVILELIIVGDRECHRRVLTAARFQSKRCDSVIMPGCRMPVNKDRWRPWDQQFNQTDHPPGAQQNQQGLSTSVRSSFTWFESVGVFFLLNIQINVSIMIRYLHVLKY